MWRQICIILHHMLDYSGSGDGQVTQFSEESWSKAKVCAAEWKNLHGEDDASAKRNKSTAATSSAGDRGQSPHEIWASPPKDCLFFLLPWPVYIFVTFERNVHISETQIKTKAFKIYSLAQNCPLDTHGLSGALKIVPYEVYCYIIYYALKLLFQIMSNNSIHVFKKLLKKTVFFV